MGLSGCCRHCIKTLAIAGGILTAGQVSAGVTSITTTAALPTMVSASPGLMHVTSGGLLATVVGPWEEYTLRGLTPELGLRHDTSPEASVPRMAPLKAWLLPPFALAWPEGTVDSGLHLDFQRQNGLFGRSGRDEPLLDEMLRPRSLNFDRQFFEPGYRGGLGRHGLWQVSAVLASQQLALWPYDDERWLTGATRDAISPFHTRSALGTGVRLGMRSEIVPGIRIGAAYRSRIDMNVLRGMRDIYADPADLDIPATANIGMSVRTTRRSTLTVGVRHIMYSGVDAFASSLLPTRFRSLLGDGSSPEFVWQDRTVYTLGLRVDAGEDTTWHFNYSTSVQPAPDSQVLADALAAEYADNNVALGLTKRTSDHSTLDVTASYAPSQHVPGVLAFGGDGTGFDEVEIEALWTWKF